MEQALGLAFELLHSPEMGDEERLEEQLEVVVHPVLLHEPGLLHVNGEHQERRDQRHLPSHYIKPIIQRKFLSSRMRCSTISLSILSFCRIFCLLKSVF